MTIHSQKNNQIRKINPLPLLIILMIPTLVLTSCSEFIDDKTSSTPVATPTPIKQPPETTPIPQVPQPAPAPQTETEDQRNWRLCEAERIWAFNSRLIDSGALRLYQSRNFAPIFNEPGTRQSGIEGWYGCKLALQANGFIPTKFSALNEVDSLD